MHVARHRPVHAGQRRERSHRARAKGVRICPLRGYHRHLDWIENSPWRGRLGRLGRARLQAALRWLGECQLLRRQSGTRWCRGGTLTLRVRTSPAWCRGRTIAWWARTVPPRAAPLTGCRGTLSGGSRVTALRGCSRSLGPPRSSPSALVYLSWLVFAALWWASNEADGECVGTLASFTGAVAFSVETQESIGYGDKYVESCVGGVVL